MARNGAGIYVLPAGQPVVSGTVVSASVFNTLASDIATELTKSICTDGQTPMAAALPMGSNKITGLAAGVATSDAVRLDQVTAKTDLAAQTGAALVGNAPSGTIISMTVQAALYELDTKKAALIGCTFTGPILADTNVKLWMGGGSIASNTGIGSGTLTANTTGTNNTAVGVNSLNSVTTGSSNFGSGSSALTAVTTGTSNVGIGVLTLGDVTTGNTNTAIGTNTGRGITTGSGNTIIGSGISGLAPGLTNNIVLGNGSGVIQAQHDGTNWTFQGTASVGAATAAAHAVIFSQVGGIGQTWTNVASSRALNTSYTNSTGKPIFVNIVTGTSGGTQAGLSITLAGVTQQLYGSSAPSGYNVYIAAEIPPGASYMSNTSSGTSIASWFELR